VENLKSKLEKYIKECVICAKKLNGVKREPMVPLELTRRNQLVAMDFLGPVNMTKRGNKYVLILVDCFTNRVFLKPAKRALSEVVVRKLKLYVAERGRIETLRHDRQISLMSEAMEEFYEEYVIGDSPTTPHSQFMDGSAEAMVKEVTIMVRAILEDGGFKGEWDECLDLIQSEYNSSLNVNGLSPNTMWFGTDLNNPEHVLERDDNSQDLKDQIELITKYIAKQRIPRKLKQASNHNKQSFILQSKLKVGDTVTYKNLASDSEKFEPPSFGPFMIIGFGASSSFVIIDKSKVREDSDSTLIGVKPYVVYSGHCRLFKKSQENFSFDVGTNDFFKTKYNQQKYWNYKLNSFPVNIIDQEEETKIFLVSYANGQVGLIRNKSSLHPKLLKNFRKRKETKMKEVNITQEDYGFGYLDLGQAFKDEDGEHIPETPLENLNQHEVPLIVENSNNPILPIQDPVSEADDLENFDPNQSLDDSDDTDESEQEVLHTEVLHRDTTKPDIVFNMPYKLDPRNMIDISQGRTAKIVAKPKISKIYKKRK